MAISMMCGSVLYDSDIAEKLVDMYDNYSEYKLERNLKLIEDPKSLKEKYPDGLVWTEFYNPDEWPFIPAEELNLDQTTKGILCMPALLFAIHYGRFKTALALLKSGKYGNLSDLPPVRLFEVGKYKRDKRKDRSVFDDDNPFDIFQEEPQSGPQYCNDPEMKELGVKKKRVKTYYAAKVVEEINSPVGIILQSLLSEENTAAYPIVHRALKVIDSSESEGWFDVGKAMDRYYYFFETKGCVGDKDIRYARFFLYLKEHDIELYRHMFSKNAWASLVMRLSYINDPNEGTFDGEAVDIASNLCLEGFDDEECMRDEYFNAVLDRSNLFFTGHTLKTGKTLLNKIWRKSSGRKLIFELNAHDIFSMTNEYEMEEEFPFVISTPGPFISPTSPFSFVGQYVRGRKISGNLLEDLIRNLDEVRQVGTEGTETVFDLECLISNLTEDVLLAALKKDFIRARDAEDCIEMCERLSRKGFVPVLLLKKFGEWDHSDHGEVDYEQSDQIK